MMMLISLMLCILSFIFNTQNETIFLNIFCILSLSLLLVSLFFYFACSVFILGLMFAKLKQFAHLMATGLKMTQTTCTANTCRHDNKKQQRDHIVKLAKRLVVLYFVSFVSTILITMTLAMIIGINIICGVNNWSKTSITTFILAVYRFPFMIDLIFNCICLLLQNTNTNHLYEKFCCICARCVAKSPCYKKVIY